MDEKEKNTLLEAILGVERVIVTQCDVLEATLKTCAKIRFDQGNGVIDLPDTEMIEQSFRALNHLSIALERLKGMAERDAAQGVETGEEQGAVLELSEEDLRGPVVIPDKEAQTLTISAVGGAIQLTKREAEVLGRVLIDQSRKL